MTGTVDIIRRPVMEVRIHGPLGAVTVPAIVDTGFNAWLAVPESLAAQLGLRLWGPIGTRLADGTFRPGSGYEAKIDWMEGSVACVALDVGLNECLIGTALLDGCVLEIDFGPAKRVEVR